MIGLPVMMSSPCVATNKAAYKLEGPSGDGSIDLSVKAVWCKMCTFQSAIIAV